MKISVSYLMHFSSVVKQRFFISCLFLFFELISNAQQIKPLTFLSNVSLRGLSVINDSVIWASGSNGKVAKSTDGKTFNWLTVKGYEARDFRDVEAFDSNTAINMAVDSPAVILKTINAGKTWKCVFRNDEKGMFLDAMDFSADGNGVVVGDPINNKLFIATTNNFGDSWRVINKDDNKFNVPSGEAFFAASGTNIKIMEFYNNANFAFVTGGTKSRLFFNEQLRDLNIIQGTDSQGANSIAIDTSGSKIIVVGGDFKNDTSSTKNIQIFSFAGKKLHPITVQTAPHGYRSCVAFITQKKLITCGISGVDVSNDEGLHWQLISNTGYNVCVKANKGKAVFLAGKNGTISTLFY